MEEIREGIKDLYRENQERKEEMLSMKAYILQQQEHLNGITPEGVSIEQMDSLKPSLEMILENMENTTKQMDTLKGEMSKIKKDQQEITAMAQTQWQEMGERIDQFIQRQAESMNGSPQQQRTRILKKIERTKKLTVELHQLLQIELKSRTVFDVRFSLYQSCVKLINDYPCKVIDYKKIVQDCKHFDDVSGVYTTPVTGTYQIYTRVILCERGSVISHVCTSQRGGQRYTGETCSTQLRPTRQGNLTLNLHRGDTVWIEVTRLDGKPGLLNCIFKGRLQTNGNNGDNGYSDDDDDDDDDNDDAANNNNQ